MGSITLGVVSSYFWHSGLPKQLALHDKNSQFADVAEHQISILWTIAFEPLLFGCIGSSLRFDLIPPGTLLTSLSIVCIGSICRVLAAFLVTARCSYSVKERVFISLAWIPKVSKIVTDLISKVTSQLLTFLDFSGNSPGCTLLLPSSSCQGSVPIRSSIAPVLYTMGKPNNKYSNFVYMLNSSTGSYLYSGSGAALAGEKGIRASGRQIVLYEWQ